MGYPGVDEVAVKKKVVTLTDAQIKALPTTPITLLPAPGAGKIISVLSASVYADKAGGAYTNIDAAQANLNIGYGDFGWPTATSFIVNKAAQALAGLTALLGDTTPRVAIFAMSPAQLIDGQQVSFPTDDAAQIVDLPLTLYCNNNQADDFTGGNAANFLTVAVLYAVVGY